MMSEENLARLRAHRNNIHRYRRLLRTHLTELERQYIENRLSAEVEAAKRISARDLPVRHWHDDATCRKGGPIVSR